MINWFYISVASWGIAGALFAWLIFNAICKKEEKDD